MSNPSEILPPDPSSDLYYHHSGNKGIALPLAILLGIPATIALAAVYAWIVVYCPVVGYVNLLFLGGFVFAGGFVIHKIAEIGKSRSTAAMTLIGLGLGLVALYFSWLFFLKALIGDVDIIAMMASPMLMWKVIAAVNAEGWWGPTGLAQWAIVTVEAAVIVGGFALAGSNSLDEKVFCEDCNTWCRPFSTMQLKKDLTAPADQRPKTNLDLLALDETSVDDFPRYDADVLQCESCQQMQAIRFFNVSQIKVEGEWKEQREEIPGILVKRG